MGPTGKYQSDLFGSYRVTTRIAICLDPQRAFRAKALTGPCFYSLGPPPDMFPVLAIDLVQAAEFARAVEFVLLPRATR